MTAMSELELDKNKLSYRFSKWIVDRPWQALAALLVTVALLVPGILTIKSSYTPKVWFDPDHENIVKLNVFEKRFGNDQNVVIGLYHPDGIFQESVLKEIQRITDEMWKVTDVIRVESLANYNYIYSEKDDIIIDPFLNEDMDYSPAALAELKKKAMADEIIPDFFVSPDGTYALLVGYMRPYFKSEPDFSKVVDDVRGITKDSSQIPGLKAYIIGDAAGNDAFREISASDNFNIIPFTIILVNLLLFFVFRSWWALIIPFVLVGITTGATFGSMGWLKILMNSLLSAIPGVLLAICMADAIHILNTYFHFRAENHGSKKAVFYSLVKNFQPTLLTSVSTAISFFSITVSEIAPVRDLGLLCGIGTMLAWVFTYLLGGSVLSILSSKLEKYPIKSFNVSYLLNKKERTAENNAFAKLLVAFINKYRILIILSFAILAVASIVISLDNEVNSDPIKYFHETVPVREAYDFSNTKMNGLKGIELVVDSGKDEGVKDPEFLKKLDKYIQWLVADSEITKVKSILEIIKKMNKVLHEGKNEFYVVPDTQRQVAEILFLYTVGLPQGMDLNNQITLDNRRLRMRVVWKIETSKETQLKANYIVEHAKDFGLNVTTGGNVPIYMQMNTLVVKSFFSSMAMALVLVGFLLLFVFKDLYISILSMLPNIIPLAFGGALMAVMGKYIDIGTSLVYTVCLGIAVDDTIHFVASYKNSRKHGKAPIDAITDTFHVTGRALFITTVLLAVGFGSFMFADFVPNRNFGMLCSIILILALMTDMLFLPALLLCLDKDKEERKTRDKFEKVTPVTHS